MLSGLIRLTILGVGSVCCTLAPTRAAQASGSVEVTAQLLFDPARPEHIVVRYYNYEGGTRRGILISEDAGRSWRLMCADAVYEQAVQSGVTRSSLDQYEVRRMRAAAIAGGGTTAISTSIGVFEGDGQGCGFRLTSFAQAQSVDALLPHPTLPEQLFALVGYEGSAQGLWRRGADGDWRRFGQGESAPGEGKRVVLKSIALAQNDTDVRVYQTVWRYTGSQGVQVLRVSDDGAQSWREISLGAEELQLLAVDPTHRDRVLGVIRRKENTPVEWSKELDWLMISDDGGQNFRRYLDVADLSAVAFGRDGTLWVSDLGQTIGDETRAGLFRAAPGLAAAPVQVSKEAYQCVGHAPGSDQYYACQGTRVGRLDAQTGAFEELVRLETVQELASCPGLDVREVCRQQLCMDGYCLMTHLPRAPVCAAYDSALCGPSSVGAGADAAVLDAALPDASSQNHAGPPIDAGTAEEDDAHASEVDEPDGDVQAPAAKKKAKGCSLGVGEQTEPGAPLGGLGLVALLWRRRRAAASRRMVRMRSWVGLALLGLTLAACGGESGEDEQEHDAGTHDAADGDGGHDVDDSIPCPSYTPTFEPGMSVAGKSNLISARLVSASPSAPRKFENSWVFEFVDAEGAAITDIEVTPHEPWMDVHGHGGGWAPDVASGGAPGTLEFDRINLKMSGPWRLNLDASSARVGTDEIVIYVCVP